MPDQASKKTIAKLKEEIQNLKSENENLKKYIKYLEFKNDTLKPPEPGLKLLLKPRK